MRLQEYLYSITKSSALWVKAANIAFTGITYAAQAHGIQFIVPDKTLSVTVSLSESGPELLSLILITGLA